MAKRVKKEVIATVKGKNIELDFNYIPKPAERNKMKDCHFRWSPRLGVWYGKNTPESRKMINHLEYLHDFVPTPKATEKDFENWIHSLKSSQIHDMAERAEPVYEKVGNAEKVWTETLHEEFAKQWC